MNLFQVYDDFLQMLNEKKYLGVLLLLLVRIEFKIF